VSRGWTTPELELTPTGLAVREEVEARTDAAMAGPLATLGDDGAERLIELVKPLSRKIVEAGGIGQV
jgi:hypothetical protein